MRVQQVPHTGDTFDFDAVFDMTSSQAAQLNQETIKRNQHLITTLTSESEKVYLCHIRRLETICIEAPTAGMKDNNG